MKIEECKQKVVEYLKTRGSIHLSQLAKELSVPKSTLYHAINQLEKEGKVKSENIGGKRIIIPIQSIPLYLKVLSVITILITISSVLVGLGSPPSVIINLNSSSTDVNSTTQITSLDVIAMLLVAISTYWFAVITLRFDDVVDAYKIVKSYIKSRLAKMKQI